MSRDASVELFFGDGEYRFRLPIAQLEELQDKTDCGPAFLLSRLRDGLWRIRDVRETIRLGLIGGGMTPLEANKLTVRYVDQRPYLEAVPVAIGVLIGALVGGGEDDPPGNSVGAEEIQTQEAGSSSQPTTDTAP